MKPRHLDALSAELIVALHKKLHETERLTKSARYCAERGQVKQAVDLLMDYEGPAYEAQELFKTILVLRRQINEAKQ